MRHALVSLLALGLACESARPTHKVRDEVCSKNLDCGYGLECVADAPLADGGTAAGKTCQLKAFGECDVPEDGGAVPQRQCLSGQVCRDGKCVVQCAGPKDCREGDVCRIGVCQHGGRARAQCYDNRDCPWPQTCFYGQCVTRTDAMRCNSDLDCAYGLHCINALCQ